MRKQVSVAGCFTVNSADAAIAAAARGRGITRVLSYQVEEAVAAGNLRLVLEEFEGERLPVHVVYPGARLQAAKLRAFVDFAVPRLRARLADLPVSSGRA